MYYKSFYILLSLVLLGLACEDTLQLEDDLAFSEEELKVIEDCQEQSITTIKQVEENLIGYWNLVGYACGRCFGGVPPTANINFHANGGYYKYNDSVEQIDAEFTWYIEEGTNIFGEPTLQLVTDPVLPGLFAEVFCQKYMALNWIPVDGPMLIYAKQR